MLVAAVSFNPGTNLSHMPYHIVLATSTAVLHTHLDCQGCAQECCEPKQHEGPVCEVDKEVATCWRIQDVLNTDIHAVQHSKTLSPS
jgi:hypothetical protein